MKRTMKRCFLHALSAASLVAITAPAWAGASASVTLQGWQMTLYDMNLSDGITPQITFLSSYDTIVGEVGDPRSISGPARSFYFLGAQAVSPLSGSATIPGAQSSATIAGDGTWPGMQQMRFNASASATQAGEAFYANARGSVATVSYTMTPYTSVIFTMMASVNSSADGLVPGSPLSAGYNGSYSSVTFSGYGPGGEGGSEPQSTNDSIATDANSVIAPHMQSVNRELSVYIYNFSERNEIGGLGLEVGVSAQSQLDAVVPQVPEPSSYALMLPGLALVGALARKRYGRV
jgi:hypothetical protein